MSTREHPADFERDVRLLDGEEARSLRELFIATFVDTGTEYYRRLAASMTTEGEYGEGYLWDCFRDPIRVIENEIWEWAAERSIYAMWDLHTAAKVLSPDYWHFPKTAVLAGHGFAIRSGDDFFRKICICSTAPFRGPAR